MYFSIILIFVFILIVLIIGYKKHLTWAFCITFLGVALLILASAIYITKFSGYRVEHQFDRFLYFTLSPHLNLFPINITDASTIVNLGLSLIMFGSAYLARIISHRKKRKLIGMSLGIIAFFIANHHLLRYREFLLLNMSLPPRLLLLVERLIAGTDIFSLLMLVLLMILPYFPLIRMCLTSEIHLLRKDSLSSLICLLMLHVFFVCYFLRGPFAGFMPWNVTLLKLPVSPIMPESQTLTTPALLLVLISTLYILIKFNPFASVKFQTKRALLKEYSELNHSLRMIFHVNKNILHTIYLLSGQALDFYEKKPEVALKNLGDIKGMASEAQETLTRMLTMLDDISIKDTETNIITCLEAAAAASVPEGISLERRYPEDEDIIVLAAPIHITETFTNVLKNSVEAIEAKNPEEKRIRLYVSTEHGYVNIEITDNGCGIRKKDKKHIFDVLHSTKKNSTNWGIGLSYAKKVVNLYKGDAHVKSELGKYTTIQLVFPLTRKK